MRNCIQVFTKAPIAGFCKTRLARQLGIKKTLEFHKSLVEETIKTALKTRNAQLELWCTPSKEHSFFEKIAHKYNLELYDQSGDTLGDIMSNAACLAKNNYNNIIQIGTDCPYMDDRYISRSIDMLDHDNEVVIGPANDGGYVLLSMKSFSASIYADIDWGTNSVLAQLEYNLQDSSINYKKLNYLDDIDTIEDYLAWDKVNEYRQ